MTRTRIPAAGLTPGSVVLPSDSRLTDARTPTAHKTSHSTGGTDAIAPADIGAAAASHAHTLSQITDAGTAASRAAPASGNATSAQVVLGSDTRLTDSRSPTSHAHGNITNAGSIGSTANLPIITTTSGVLATGTFGTAANTFAAGNHTHGNVTNAGAIGSTANLPVITTTSGVLTTGTFGTAANSFCQGNDSRLSDARTPTAHTHGNITNAGAIGSTANLPVITTTSGALTTGTFGTTANTFCQGNDSRLSDARTPTTHTHTASQISDSTADGRTILTSSNVYACRAWVNFNGTGTVAIRASRNVTSITDHGTGDYTVNFTTSMADANYAFVGTWGTGANTSTVPTTTRPGAAAAGSIRFSTNYFTGGGTFLQDADFCYVAIFR